MSSHPRAIHGVLMGALLGLLSGCDGAAPLRVGLATSRSQLDAARLAVEANTRDGAGTLLDTIVLVDPSNRAEPAITAADSLVRVDGLVAVVGHSNSAASLAASQIYNDHEVVQIAPSSSAVLFSRAGPFSFRLVPPDDRQGAFLARYLAERMTGGRLAVMYINDDYGRGLLRAFLDALNQERFAVVARVPHTENESDSTVIAHQIATAAEARPDLVVWLARGQVLHRYLPRLRAALGDVPVVGSDATSTAQEWDDRWKGVVYVDFVDLDASPAIRAFARAYEKRFGQPAAGADALTYDALRLVYAGVGSGARSGPELRDWLLELGRTRPAFPGVTGPIVFEPDGDIARPYVIVPAWPPR